MLRTSWPFSGECLIGLHSSQLINSIIPKVENKPASSLPHSASLPTFTNQGAKSTPTVIGRPSRRHSDRVRSPSDSSSSDSDDQQRVMQTSVTKPFPLGSSRETTNIPRPVAQRVKKLSDPSKLESPLAIRRRGAQQPPSAYSPFGAFSRPSPANRRRRGSAESSPGLDMTGDADSRPPSQARVRKISQPSMRSSSPLWSGSQPSNPSSPLFPTIYARHQAGDVNADSIEPDDLEDAELSLQLQANGPSDASEEVDQVDEDVLGASFYPNDSLNPRLIRISVSRSTQPLDTCFINCPDRVFSFSSHISRQTTIAAETERRARSQAQGRGKAISSHRVSIESHRKGVMSDFTNSVENERLVEDLQDRLEEAKAEIALKRKDEKDLKSKDRAQTIQIAGVSYDSYTSGSEILLDTSSSKPTSRVFRGVWKLPRPTIPT